jgi:hypothetical protein
MNNTLVEMYLTIFVQRTLNKLKEDNLSFINVYVSKSIYSILNTSSVKTMDDKTIIFILDSDRTGISADYERLKEINISDPTSFF